MKEITFIHTADLHLDSPFRGLAHLPHSLYEKVKESTFLAFENVINHAIEKQVDFVLIVGDLFDADDRSIRAQARLRKQLERLNEVQIKAIICHGNHDYIGLEQLYLQLPENTYVFHHEVETIKIETKTGCHVNLYGFSYDKRHVYERKINQYEKKQDADFHIGLLHGQVDGGSTYHQPYAPFSIDELADKDFDYWALGHIHQTQIIHKEPHIVYPGNTQGRHRKESGPKICYEVQLYETGETYVNEIETAVIRWEKLIVELQELPTLTAIYHILKDAINETIEKINNGLIVHIELVVQDSLSNKLEQLIAQGELIEMLQDEYEASEQFIWVNHIQLLIKEKEIALDGFTQMLLNKGMEFLDEGCFEQAAAPLMKHPQGARYLEQIGYKDRQDILHAAQQMIRKKLKE